MTEEPVARGEIVNEAGARFEVFRLPDDEDTLLNVLKDCFAEWRHIRIGPLIPGALWEIRPPGEPSITADNGYATVDFHDGHLHLCIGEREGVRPELARIRRTNRVELFRRLDGWEQAFRWGLRLLNGAGQHLLVSLAGWGASFDSSHQIFRQGLEKQHQSIPVEQSLEVVVDHRIAVFPD